MLPSDRLGLQAVGHHIVDILDEHHVGINLVEILDECTMSARTEQERAVFVAERCIVRVGGNRIRAWLLLGERDIVLDTVTPGILVGLLCHHLLEEFQMVVGNSEVDIGLAIAACIESGLHQMLLHRSAHLVLILMELEQSLGQLTIVQPLGLQEIGHYGLVVSLLHELLDALLIIHTALVAKSLAESKLLDVVEELLFKVGCRNVIWSVKEGEHILEHTTGRTRGRHKFHNLVTFGLVVIPSLLILLNFLGRRSNDTLTNGGCPLKFEERKTTLDLFQLVFNLLLRNATSCNLVKILLSHNTIFMLNLCYLCHKVSCFFR